MKPKKSPKEICKGNSYLVIFDNEQVMSIYADSKAEAMERAISAVEKISGVNRDNLVNIKDVVTCH